MSNSNNSNNFKEKLIQALTSTAKVISDDFEIKENLDQNKSSKELSITFSTSNS